MSLTGKHILSSDQFDRPTLERLFELADLLRPVARGEQVTRVLEGAVMGSLSSRPARVPGSVADSAFMRLGGSVSHSTGFAITSISKGESLADTSRWSAATSTSSSCATPKSRRSRFRRRHQHPRGQRRERGRRAPDPGAARPLRPQPRVRPRRQDDRRRTGGPRRRPQDGRTVHSLVKLLSLYRDLTIVCVSPRELRMPGNCSIWPRGAGTGWSRRTRRSRAYWEPT